eukprot:jgi/Ulvmu1/7560/UM037_0104.1
MEFAPNRTELSKWSTWLRQYQNLGKALELTWRYAFYGRINYFREQAMKKCNEEAVVSMTNCCLGGILYFKQLLVQIHHCYPSCTFMVDLHLGMSMNAEEKAIGAAPRLPTNQPVDKEAIRSVVQMCLVRMGDLARYLSDMPLHRVDGKLLQDNARNDAAQYYLKAQRLNVSNGLIYNQLGAVLERRDSASSVCLGACMHFAIAATAESPARSGIANFRRSIGIHRNALQNFRKGHSLNVTRTMPNQRFTHLVHLVSLCIVPAFGTGVDQVDVDKGWDLWQTLAPTLQAVLIHPHYEQCASSRRPDQDIGLQAACFACICVWYAHEQIKKCIDQVQSMGHCTIFAALAPLLIDMGRVYADAAVTILQQHSCHQASPALRVVRRCISALLLVLHVLTSQIDDQVYVQAYDATKSIVEACESLAMSLAASRSQVYDSLPGPVLGCDIFCGSAAFSSMAEASGRVGNDVMPVKEAILGLADRLAEIEWHDPICQLGVHLAASIKQSMPFYSNTRTPPVVQETSHGTSTDDLEDIVLLPGQLAQRM